MDYDTLAFLLWMESQEQKCDNCRYRLSCPEAAPGLKCDEWEQDK